MYIHTFMHTCIHTLLSFPKGAFQYIYIYIYIYIYWLLINRMWSRYGIVFAWGFCICISNLRLTFALGCISWHVTQIRSVKNRLIFEDFLLLPGFRFNQYLCYLQFIRLRYIRFIFHCIWRWSMTYFIRVFYTFCGRSNCR